GLLVRGGGLLVGLVQVLLAALLVGDRALEAGELALGLLGPGHGGGDGLAQPPDLGLARLDAGAAGPDLAGEAGVALAAVGRPLAAPGGPLLLGGGGLLRGFPGRDRLAELLGDLLDLAAQGLLVGAHPLGLGAQLLGATAGGGLLGLVLSEEADPLGGEGG